jgi:outer membrane lipoprotein-sorting protein
MRRRTFTAMLFLLGSLLGGCSTAGKCPAQLLTDPTRVLAKQQARSASLRTLRAEAKVDQRGREGRIKGRVMMFVERPARVRFDAVTQFGPALTLTSDGERFALSDFKSNRYLTGPACERNIARMIGVALSGRDVASVMMGESPLIEASSSSMVCQGGSYVISRTASDGGRQELELRVHEADLEQPPEQQRLYLVRASFWNAAGKELYRVRYEDYRASAPGKLELPHTVHIDDYVNDADALLHFSSIDVNVNVPPDAFAQEPRSGLTVEEILCESP